MKVGNYYLGRNDSKICGISDKQILLDFTAKLAMCEPNDLTLVGVTPQGPKTWTLKQELKEMRGHLNGLIRSRYGREMLDARKLAMAERLRFGGMRPSVSPTNR